MIKNINVHKSSLIGKRQQNEDVELYCSNLLANGKPSNIAYGAVDVFIICDGHGGTAVSAFVAPKMMDFFLKKALVYPLTPKIVTKLFSNIQKELIVHNQRIANNCGSTAIVLIRFIDNITKAEKIQLVNIGDCRAIMSRKGISKVLTKDHKPFWPDEKYRIDKVNKQYGTDVKVRFADGDWRIGDLSVSRAFGDLDNTPYVTHKPDTFVYKIKPTDEFIIMACDGVWDVLQNHEAINFVRDHDYDNGVQYYNFRARTPAEGYPPNDAVRHTKNIAEKLANYAIAKGSTDNVSVIIIFFVKNR